MEAARRANSLDSDKVREELLKTRTRTVFGDFAVDERGFQIGHKAVTVQWQAGKQVVVWPDDVAAGKLRFPHSGVERTISQFIYRLGISIIWAGFTTLLSRRDDRLRPGRLDLSDKGARVIAFVRKHLLGPKPCNERRAPA